MTKAKNQNRSPIPDDADATDNGAKTAGLSAADPNLPDLSGGAPRDPVDPLSAAKEAKKQQDAVAEKKRAEAAPVKKKRTRAEILAEIEAESLSRVNIDEFLDARGEDPYYIPAHLIPDGFTVEWKSTHVMGQPMEANYHLKLNQGGWRPAPIELFPGLVPDGYDREFVERPGMMLMIRPAKLTEMIRQADYHRAVSQVDDKMRQLYQTPDNNLDRVVTVNKKSYEIRKEAQAVPADKE